MDMLRRPALIFFLVTVLTAVMPAQEASEPRNPALMPRFALAVQARPADPGLRVVLDTALNALASQEQALWFLLEPAAEADASAEAEPAADANAQADVAERLAARAWEEHQAEVMVLLTVEAAEPSANESAGTDQAAADSTDAEGPGAENPATVARGSTVRIRARLYTVRPASGGAPEGIGFWEGAVQIDAAGRYQRDELWGGLVEAVFEHADAARPVVTLTLRSNGPIEVLGLPEWAPVTAAGETERVVTLRSLREYSFTVSRPGARARELTVYVERRPVTMNVELTPYPRHTLAATLRGLAWPGLEYAWYNEATTWTLRAGITSFLVGLTPLRQVAADSAEPRVISSYGLTEVELGWHALLGNRDRLHRFTAGAGAALRLVHGNVSFGLDPAIPWALRPTLGSEWELGRRLILSQRLGTDLFISPRPAFVPASAWTQRIGPVFWQLPIYRLGVRVRL